MVRQNFELVSKATAINIRRIGFVASEITKNGGVAICAPIAPYRETRRVVRELIEITVPLSRSTLPPCWRYEAEDRKGLYAKPEGIIPDFTGGIKGSI